MHRHQQSQSLPLEHMFKQNFYSIFTLFSLELELHKTIIDSRSLLCLLSCRISSEQKAAHKLAPALSHMHMQDTQAYNCTLQHPPGEQTWLILKQELDNSLKSSRVNQTPHSFCCPNRSALVPRHQSSITADKIKSQKLGTTGFINWKRRTWREWELNER